MTFLTSYSATTIPSTWPTIAHNKIDKIAAKAPWVSRQDSNADYSRNYCESCPKGWGPTKAGQISIWVFGGLALIALGIAIGYIWRKCRGQSILDEKETEIGDAQNQASDRDATITELRATITRLKKDIQEANKEKAKDTVPLSTHSTGNDAGPPRTTKAFDKGKGKAKVNVTTTDPATHPHAIEMSPVGTAPTDKSLASGALQEKSQSLPNERSSRGVALSSSGALDGPSTEDPKPRKPPKERLAVVVQEVRRSGETRAEPLSASRSPSGQAQKLTTFERHGSAHRQIASNSTSNSGAELHRLG